jgi:hypothetical protein
MSMASLRRGLARVPAWVVDAGWAVAVAVAVTIAIRVAREPGARAPDLLAYALGWTIGALLLARRRWPVAVLAASFATLQVYYVLNYRGMSAAVPLAVALYTAGAAGHLRWALLVAAWFVAGPIVFRLFVDPELVLPVLAELLRDASLWLATLLLGDAVRSRRALSRAYRLLEVERAWSDGLLREPIAGRLKQREEVNRRRLRRGDRAVLGWNLMVLREVMGGRQSLGKVPECRFHGLVRPSRARTGWRRGRCGAGRRQCCGRRGRAGAGLVRDNPWVP